MRLKSYMLVLFLLSACGRSGFEFHSSVPSEQRALMEEDLNRLSSMNLPIANPQDLQILGMPDLRASTLRDWLAHRVRFIVGESFSWKQNYTLIARSGPSYPGLVASTNTAALGDSGTVTVMWNLGAHLYLETKNTSSEALFEFEGFQIPVKSPRVSLVQIGSGLFNSARLKNFPLDSMARTILRLGTYFHEGRHGDGNGEHTAFPHATCPSSSSINEAYHGKYACEANLNGPYAIQARLLKYLYYACRNCSQEELAALELSITDYNTRIFPSAQYRDPRPEGYR